MDLNKFLTQAYIRYSKETIFDENSKLFQNGFDVRNNEKKNLKGLFI